jgi:hypothetical protein
MRSTSARILSRFGVACFAAALAAVPAAAAEYLGVSFAKEIRVESQTLQLRGVGRVKYLRVFDVYVGALYLPPQSASESALEEIPKRLELAYLRDIPADKIVEAGEEFLKRNTTAAERGRLRPKLDRINALYRDVRQGDRYTLTYVPGRGTTLALNERVLGEIPGDEFARAYYKIWLGDSPVSETFRDRILRDTSGNGASL